MAYLTRLFQGAALTGALLLGAAAPTVAQVSGGQDVYVQVAAGERQDGTPQPFVVYVFSDPAQSGMAPIEAMAAYPVGEFDPQRQFSADDCVMTFDWSIESIPDPDSARLIYGPSSEQDSVDVFALPSYMAREASKLLLERGLVATEVSVRPFFNCSGFLWSAATSLTEEQWRQIIEENLPQ